MFLKEWQKMTDNKNFNPDMALDTIRTVYGMIENGIDPDNLDRQVVAFMSATLDLDQWITEGGVLPSDWIRISEEKITCGEHNIEYVAQMCPKCYDDGHPHISWEELKATRSSRIE